VEAADGKGCNDNTA